MNMDRRQVSVNSARTWAYLECRKKKRRLKCNTQLYTTVRTNHTCIPIQICWSDLRLESFCRIAVVVISANRAKIRLESCTTSPNTGYARTSTVQPRLSGNLHNFEIFGRILAVKTGPSNLSTPPNQDLIYERSNRHSKHAQDRFHGKMLEQTHILRASARITETEKWLQLLLVLL